MTRSMVFCGCSLHTVARRLSARSKIPLVSMLLLFKSTMEGSLWKFSISLLALVAICSGRHLAHGCARISAILAFVVAVQYMTYSASTLCAAVEFSTPIFGKLAQAPMKRPAAAVDYLSMPELAEHEAAIQEWLSTDPDMGKRTLCRKMLSEKGCHVGPTTAGSYLIRLRREPVTPSRRRRRTMRGAGDLGGEPDAAVEYLSISQLAEHEGAIQEWLSTDPDMGQRTLCSKMLSEKGHHVKPTTAQHYLRRLRRPAETPTRRNRRSMRGSSSAIVDVTNLRKLDRQQLEPYMPLFREAFQEKPSMTQPGLRALAAEHGVTASKAIMHSLWEAGYSWQGPQEFVRVLSH